MSALKREDYFLRQVQAVAAMLARIAGLRLNGNVEEASREMEHAYSTLLGSRGELIRRMDAKTAARLLGSTDAVSMFARLLDEEAALEPDAERRAHLVSRAAEVREAAATGGETS